MKIYSAAALKAATCEPKAECDTTGKEYMAAAAYVEGMKVVCMGAAGSTTAASGDAKATDEKACDALADATDDAKKACKEWAGKKCADEKDEEKKKSCEAAKASAKALAASALAVAALAALM